MAFQSGPLYNASMAALRIEPIMKQTKSEIQEKLNQQVRIKRDLQKQRQNNPLLLSENSQLNTTSTGMLDIFKPTQDEAIEEETDDLRRLLAVGSISIFEDVDESKRPLITLNTAEYKAKRSRIEVKVPGPTRFETFTKPIDPPDSTNSLLSIVANTYSDSDPNSEPNRNVKKISVESLGVMSRNTTHPSTASTQYPSQMVPISATPEQIQECDFVTRSARGSEIEPDLALRKSIDSLSCAFVDFLSSPEDVHKVSGKLVFISQFLNSLKNKDLTIVIVTQDLNEESAVFYLVNDKLSLSCTRLGNVVDEGWNGEYGIFLKTKKSDGPMRSVIGLFSPMADLTLCLSIALDSNLPIFSSIKKNEKESAPVVWLIVAGSFEEKAFRLMKQEGLTFSQCQNKMLDLLCLDNQWPKELEQLNKNSIHDLASWVQSKKNTVYSYSLESLSVPTPEVSVLDAASDMDIDSDIEMEHVNETVIRAAPPSAALSDYISKSVFPISIAMVPLSNKETEKSLSPDELNLVNTIRKDKSPSYLQEIDKLRTEFEEKQKVIQIKYINETKKEYF
ncbi:hypothetical protein BY458DRAFT_506424 [Sporodiniella umbellata]|nr:hypothetical protein BY458DRAFT_506424 [Sporodiniella umbellata]